MLTLRAPSPEVIADYLAGQRGLALTYSTEGMTRGAAPADFTVDHRRERIGEGAAAFERAAAGLQAWAMFRMRWVQLHAGDGPPAAGDVVAIVIRVGPTWWLNACRVLYLIDEQAPVRRVGFAYGTLPGHAERGEERFCVELGADGGVWYELLAYSRPLHWLARAGYPLTRLMQRRFGAGSVAAMRRAVTG